MTRIGLFRCALVLLLVSGCSARVECAASTNSNLVSFSGKDSGKHVAVARAQAIEITLQTTGHQQYGAPKVSSHALRYESVAVKMPPDAGLSTQVLRFRAVAEGEAAILLTSINPENVFGITVKVGPARAHASRPRLPDQANTGTWANAWTNLLNDARPRYGFRELMRESKSSQHSVKRFLDGGRVHPSPREKLKAAIERLDRANQSKRQ